MKMSERKNKEIPVVVKLDPEEIVGAEWWAWAQLTPEERFSQMELIWNDCIALGMSLDAEPDTQSPFYDPNEQCSLASYGGAGLRILRSSPD